MKATCPRLWSLPTKHRVRESSWYSQCIEWSVASLLETKWTCVACSQMYIRKQRCNMLLHTNSKAKNPTHTYVCCEYIHVMQHAGQALPDSTRHKKDDPCSNKHCHTPCVCFSAVSHCWWYCHLMHVREPQRSVPDCTPTRSAHHFDSIIVLHATITVLRTH